MKLTKLARENPGKKVFGSLLGMNKQRILEITDCFMVPEILKGKASDEGEIDEKSQQEKDLERMQDYKARMLDTMRGLNSDFDEVGLFKVITYLILLDFFIFVFCFPKAFLFPFCSNDSQHD